VSARLQVLFLAALGGVLAVLGLLAWGIAGPVAAWAYSVGVVALLVVGAWRARLAAVPAGRTCTCCTSTVHDPVQVR